MIHVQYRYEQQLRVRGDLTKNLMMHPIMHIVNNPKILRGHDGYVVFHPYAQEVKNGAIMQ